MHNQGEEKSVTERISRCHVNPTFLVLMIIFLWSCRRRSSFPFSIWNQKSCFAKPRRGFKADLLFRQRSYVWLRNILFPYKHVTCSRGLFGLWPVFLSYWARWKGMKVSPLQSGSYISSHFSMPMRCISMGHPCSEAIKISALTTWPAIKWIENLLLESPFSTFRGWMDENQALLFWCLASIIRIVWRTTDSCCVSWYYGSKNLSMLDISARSKKSWQTIPWWWRGVGIFWF